MPYGISKALSTLPEPLLENANEIRLRLNLPLSVTSGGKNIPFGSVGVCRIENALCATRDDIAYCLSMLSESSLYSYEHTLRNGFIPIEDGRAGICGATVTENGAVKSFREVYAVNLRYHRFVRHFADKLISYYAKNGVCGTLIYAPPALGKTTLIRSAAALLAGGIGIRTYRVGIADERCEIYMASMKNGFMDVISGCEKAEGITLLTRTMSPEIIVCDELSATDAFAVTEAQNTGVVLIATAHGNSLNVRGRDFVNEMIRKKVFEIGVGLIFENGEYKYCIERF